MSDAKIIPLSENFELYRAGVQNVLRLATDILAGEPYNVQPGERVRVADIVSMACTAAPDLPARVRLLIALDRPEDARAEVGQALATLLNLDEWIFTPQPTVAEYAFLLSRLHSDHDGMSADQRKYYFSTADRATVDDRRRGAFSLRHRIGASGRTPPAPGDEGVFAAYAHKIRP